MCGNASDDLARCSAALSGPSVMLSDVFARSWLRSCTYTRRLHLGSTKTLVLFRFEDARAHGSLASAAARQKTMAMLLHCHKYIMYRGAVMLTWRPKYN